MAKRPQSPPADGSQDFTGRRIGKITVLNYARSISKGVIFERWKCRCECGRIRYITPSNLSSSIVRPCKNCSDGFDEAEISLLNANLLATPIKKCIRCRKLLPFSGFPTFKLKTGRIKAKSRCKTCAKEYDQTFHAKLKANNPHTYKTILEGRRIKSLYGISVEQRDSMIKNQEGKCLICKRAKPLHVDHCHKTNRVRAMLCGNCNRGIGLFEENSDLLLNAVAYLANTKILCPENVAPR